MKNQQIFKVDDFIEGQTKFTRLQLVKNRGNNFYAATDTNGYVTTLMRNLRFKNRLYTQSPEIKNAVTIRDYLAVVHPRSIAFSKLLDDKMYPWYCEASFSGAYELTSLVAPENYRSYQNYLYAMNTLGELVIFDVGLPRGGDRNGQGEQGGECKLVARLVIPQEFTSG